jgi:hypothetical protein
LSIRRERQRIFLDQNVRVVGLFGISNEKPAFIWLHGHRPAFGRYVSLGQPTTPKDHRLTIPPRSHDKGVKQQAKYTSLASRIFESVDAFDQDLAWSEGECDEDGSCLHVVHVVRALGRDMKLDDL